MLAIPEDLDPHFSFAAQESVTQAQTAAHLLNHDYLGTEHLLMGLLRQEDGIAATALASLGLTADAVRGQIEEIVGAGKSAEDANLTPTPRFTRVMEFSWREALQLGSEKVQAHHLLMAIVREGEGMACVIMVKLGFDLPDVKRAVINEMSIRNTSVAPPPNPKLVAAAQLIREAAGLQPEAPARTLAFQGTDDEIGEVVGWLRQRFPRTHLGYRLAASLEESLGP